MEVARQLYLVNPKNYIRDKFLPEWFNSICDLSEKTKWSYKSTLNKFFDWFLDNEYSIEDKYILKHYKSYLMKHAKRHTPNTINNYLSRVQTFFEFLRDEEHIDIKWNPRKAVKHLRVREDFNGTAFDEKQVAAFLREVDAAKWSNEANIRNRAFFMILPYTALRSFPLLEARVSDIEDTGDEMYLKFRNKGEYIKDDKIFIPSPAADALREYFAARPDINHTQALFIPIACRRKGSNCNPISYCTMKYWFNEIKRNAGLAHTNLTIHSFRSGVATQLAKMGTKTESIKNLLRHKDIRTTDKYYNKWRDNEKDLQVLLNYESDDVFRVCNTGSYFQRLNNVLYSESRKQGISSEKFPIFYQNEMERIITEREQKLRLIA